MIAWAVLGTEMQVFSVASQSTDYFPEVIEQAGRDAWGPLEDFGLLG
jgi:hypothetical protein